MNNCFCVLKNQKVLCLSVIKKLLTCDFSHSRPLIDDTSKIISQSKNFNKMTFPYKSVERTSRVDQIENFISRTNCVI